MLQGVFAANTRFLYTINVMSNHPAVIHSPLCCLLLPWLWRLMAPCLFLGLLWVPRLQALHYLLFYLQSTQVLC